ncbi:MAG: hypothetical protein HC817_05055 [Saprospiraceae bacterium]|nr:hypothetical protein [Saprospiraceae bacterium]
MAGVLDMNFRKGNNQTRHTTLSAGVIGFDAATEGYFSRKSKASYLVNARYSFTGLLGAMGIDFGGEVIDFQDFSVHLNFPTKRAGDFFFFCRRRH